MNDDELTTNMSRLLQSLKLGGAYWQRGYINNQRKELARLRSLKTTWIGTLENDLRVEVDNYLNG